MKLHILTVLIVIFSLVVAKPLPLPQLPLQPQPPAPPTSDQVQQALYGMPRSGIVGMADNIGAGLSNFGNGQGSALNAIASALFNAFGNLMSGIFGSGVINTKFANYNNLPLGVTTPRPGGAGAGGARPPAGGAPAEEPAEEERK